VALLAAVLFGVSRVSVAAKLDPEIGRKLVHISLGLYCLTFPWVFEAAWEVWATCTLAVVVFALARGVMRTSLGQGLHRVSRKSYGELLFAFAVALLFWLKDGHYITLSDQRDMRLGPVLYVLPILILTLCDAASAIVGARYGRKVFHVEQGLKSMEGVIAFAVTAWLAAMIVLLLLTDLPRGDVILLAFIAAVFGALLEAASWRGLDNLFIPLGLYFLLANLLFLGTPGLAGIAGLFFATLMGLLYLMRDEGERRHFMAVSATLFFCIAIFSGIESVLLPVIAVVAYLVCVHAQRIERPKYDDLNLLLVVLAIALVCYVVSNLAHLDTIFAFNLAFAALTAGIVAWSGAGIVWTVLAAALAWGAMLVRTVWIEGVSHETWTFAILASGGIAALAAAGFVLRKRVTQHPWMALGSLSMIAGFAALPAAPA
jgi:dolichol kinase